MNSSHDKLTGGELAIYLSVLAGILIWQTTAQVFEVVICGVFALVFGILLDRIAVHAESIEEE